MCDWQAHGRPAEGTARLLLPFTGRIDRAFQRAGASSAVAAHQETTSTYTRITGDQSRLQTITTKQQTRQMYQFGFDFSSSLFPLSKARRLCCCGMCVLNMFVHACVYKICSFMRVCVCVHVMLQWQASFKALQDVPPVSPSPNPTIPLPRRHLGAALCSTYLRSHDLASISLLKQRWPMAPCHQCGTDDGSARSTTSPWRH